MTYTIIALAFILVYLATEFPLFRLLGMILCIISYFGILYVIWIISKDIWPPFFWLSFIFSIAYGFFLVVLKKSVDKVIFHL